jgi:beta-glucuronidase
MKIPTDWNTADDQLFFYEGTVWFKRSFNYTKKADRRAILYFGAVNYEAIVYVNGHRVGKHIGGFTPFNFDITDELRDSENVVVVKVDNKRHRDNVPTQIFDWWNYGGITRDVLLFEVGDTFVDDYVVQLAKGNQRLIDMQVRLNKAVAGQQVVVNIPELKLSDKGLFDVKQFGFISVFKE